MQTYGLENWDLGLDVPNRWTMCYDTGHETYDSFKPDRCAMCVPGLFRAILGPNPTLISS